MATSIAIATTTAAAADCSNRWSMQSLSSAHPSLTSKTCASIRISSASYHCQSLSLSLRRAKQPQRRVYISSPNFTLAMTKVYPKANVAAKDTAFVLTVTTAKSAASDGNVAALTVWKKSLLFNCNGFTVYDGKGDLVFRVDNYMQGNKGEIVLMDAAGKPLLTIRRKRLSLGDNWLVFDGETNVNPRFSVRKHFHILNHKCLAHVSSTNTCSDHGTASSSNNKNVMFEIEGSYTQRSCAVYDGKKRTVAEIKKKESVKGVAFGVDVFCLIVQPEIDTADAMALVIILDQMFGSSRRFSS